MSRSVKAMPEVPGPSSPELDGVYRRIGWRLLPFLLLAYGVAYLDRINVAFAQVEMSHDLGFTNAIYGFGAGIFFIGYMLFEIPCNYVLTRAGVRRTVGSIMVIWGLACCAMAAMQGPLSFYVLRFLLGVAEAGFAPAFILYVSRWFPARYQGRVMSLLMSGPFMAGIVGGPVSGLIMSHMDGLGGLQGWQWMFVIEGVIPVALGLIAFGLLVERPSEASWLTPEERTRVTADCTGSGKDEGQTRFVEAFRNPVVYFLALSYFCLAFAGYALTFWMPSLIKSAGVDDVEIIGYLTAAPALVAVLAMNACGFLSDRTGGRVRYIVVGAFLSAVGLVLIPMAAGNLWLAMLALCVGKAAMNSANAMLWALPNTYLRGPEAAGGVAIIVTVGVLGGFLSPILVGHLRDLTGAFDAAFFVTAAIVLLTCVLAPLAARAAASRANVA